MNTALDTCNDLRWCSFVGRFQNVIEAEGPAHTLDRSYTVRRIKLPYWVSLLQALVVPFVAVVAALIAFQQMCIARQKLQMDAFARLYEQRKQVYEATREILSKVYGSLSQDDLRVYGLKVLDAKFLFDEELSAYLKLILHYVGQWEHCNQMAQASSGAEKAEYRKMKKKHPIGSGNRVTI